MSCSVHDLVRLERLGVATAGVGTEPFADEALEQAALLGMPGYRMVWVPHPVQLLTAEELDARADAAMAPILARLLANSSTANIS
ncbi:MAG TPA: hypothetical protein VFX13_14840 [Gaiellales bacterium]|nr:hypothetical protein [Gaiellales bacterium]